MNRKLTSCKNLIVFVEGDTDYLVYNRIKIALLKTRTQLKIKAKTTIEIKNLKGVGNYKDNVLRQFRFLKSERDKEQGKHSYVVFLCRDTDIEHQPFRSQPVIHWGKVKAELKRAGADRVYDIKAEQSIEDWLLLDEEGIVNYFGITRPCKLKGKDGYHKLQALYRKYKNRNYVKGDNSKDLIEKINISLIMMKCCKEIQHICKELGIKCDGKNANCVK